MEKKIILIVDDDARNIFALSAVLKARSFTCVSCSSAEDALQLLRGTDPIDYVLIDMMMPDMDGYEAIPLIKQIAHRENTPVISVTAQAMIGDREKCMNAGADGYISKPVDIDKLMNLLSGFSQ